MSLEQLQLPDVFSPASAKTADYFRGLRAFPTFLSLCRQPFSRRTKSSTARTLKLWSISLQHGVLRRYGFGRLFLSVPIRLLRHQTQHRFRLVDVPSLVFVRQLTSCRIVTKKIDPTKPDSAILTCMAVFSYPSPDHHGISPNTVFVFCSLCTSTCMSQYSSQVMSP